MGVVQQGESDELMTRILIRNFIESHESKVTEHEFDRGTSLHLNTKLLIQFMADLSRIHILKRSIL